MTFHMKLKKLLKLFHFLRVHIGIPRVCDFSQKQEHALCRWQGIKRQKSLYITVDERSNYGRKR